MTCPLKHRSQPGIPRNLFEAIFYVLPLGGLRRRYEVLIYRMLHDILDNEHLQ